MIVEPVAGSTGVLPPPKGYLQRLRAICDKHGILLIFDEVITGFGRLGYAFAAERYGVVPDMITFAKGITSGSVPMGGVLVRKGIYDAFMNGPEHVIELFHGYTYSAHPLACAAGLATLDHLSRRGSVRARAQEARAALGAGRDGPEGPAQRARHPHRRPDGRHRSRQQARRRRQARLRGAGAAFHDHDLMLRAVGDTLALSPPLIVSESQIGEIFDKVGKIIKRWRRLLSSPRSGDPVTPCFEIPPFGSRLRRLAGRDDAMACAASISGHLARVNLRP